MVHADLHGDESVMMLRGMRFRGKCSRFWLSCPSADFPVSPLPPPPLSHPLNAASLALDNSLEEDGAENGPILAALEGLRTALEAGSKDPLELNAGVCVCVGGGCVNVCWRVCVRMCMPLRRGCMCVFVWGGGV